jgi:hypothetical protein
MLAEEALHPFRIGDFPYDLCFRLAGEGFQQEEALGRFVQRIPGAELALAVELLSEPRQDFGVHRGDFLPLVMTPFDGEDLLFWLPRLGTLALQTSP